MTLDYYYEFKKIEETRTRIDCSGRTGIYNPLEKRRNVQGKLFIYLSHNTYTKGDTETKADLVLSKGKHISSIYMPKEGALFGFGDMRDTNDTLLFILHDVKIINGALMPGARLEIFVVENGKNQTNLLYNMFCDGLLDDEIKTLRERKIKYS